MKHKHLIVATILMIAFLASCSSGRYVNNSTNLNLNQTQVVLSTNNFRVVKTVNAIVVYKQGLNFDYRYLAQNAYAELIRKANLTGSQMLVNVTLENVQRITGFTTKSTKQQNAVMAQGVVIEFCDPSMVGVPSVVSQPASAQQYSNVTQPTSAQSPAIVAQPTKLTEDEVSIPDKVFRAYLVKSFDANKDGFLSLEELASIRRIDIPSLGVADLTGIEFMPQLTIINARNNNLTTVDVSSNINLGVLVLNKNPNLKKIICDKSQRKCRVYKDSRIAGVVFKN